MEKKEATQTINERINGIIEKEGYTIATFAKRIDVPWTTVKNLVSSRNAPSYEIMLKIIDAVSWVDANYLLLGTTSEKESNTDLLSLVDRLNKTIESQQTTIDRLTKKMLEK